MAFESGDVSSDFILAVWGLIGDIRTVQKKAQPLRLRRF
jgi:hypothetical protein